MSSDTRRIVLLALACGVLVDVVGPGNAAGVNLPLVTLACVAAAFFVAGRPGLRRMDPADAWLAPAAIALSAMAVIRADDWLVAWGAVLAGALAAGAVACLAGGRITRGVVPRVLDLTSDLVEAAMIGAATLLRRAQRERAQGAGDGPAGPSALERLGILVRPVAPVLRGLVVALPVVVVFAGLFAAADAVFARIATDVLAWQPDIDLGDVAFRTLVIGSVAWIATGLLGLGAGLLPRGDVADDARGVRHDPSPAAAIEPAGPEPPGPPRPTWGGGAAGRLTAWKPATPPARRLRLPSAEAATVLVVLDVLFGAFVALQLAYLFGGRDTLSVAGLSYAEYARRGFFELVLVAVLAGALVVTLDLAVAARTRAQLGAALVLVALTGVILASALLRLRLYQDAYGWTELRFVVLTAIGWLAVALVLTAALLLTRRTAWTLHVLGVMVLVTVMGMSLVGPQAFVAQRNLERAVDPALVPPGGRTGLDAAYLDELGDEAVGPVVEAWSQLGPPDRASLTPFLERRSVALGTDPELLGWPAWNLTRERARSALAAWAARPDR